MKLSKKVQRILMASAVVLALGTGHAMAAPTNTDFGSCVGADDSGGAGKDCTAATGHASISVTSTLSVNEMRALSFGNVAASQPVANSTLVLNLDGSRTNGGFVLLKGADGGTTGGGLAGTPQELGSQSPGHYTISGGAEDVAVYISFANENGDTVDMCDSAETLCDDYHPGKSVAISGGDGLTLDHFFINQSGSDVYGHYITSTAGGVAPGIADPWLPGGTTSHTGGKSNGTTDGQVDVVVGGRLNSDGSQLVVGKHVGTFNIMASY